MKDTLDFGWISTDNQEVCNQLHQQLNHGAILNSSCEAYYNNVYEDDEANYLDLNPQSRHLWLTTLAASASECPSIIYGTQSIMTALIKNLLLH